MHTITRRMDAVLTELEDEFNSMYCIKDFKYKLEELKKAENTSDRPSVLDDLYVMFDKMFNDSKIFKYEREKNVEYYERLINEYGKRIPKDFKEIQDKMLNALYSKFDKYPSPEAFMKRIVDQLSDEDNRWQNDTLRLRILKQFIKYGNYLQNAGFHGRGHIRRFVRNKINRRLPNDDVENVLNNLNDEVFNCLKDANDDQRSPDGTYGLLKVADDLATGKFRVEGATKRALYLFAIVYNMTYYSKSNSQKPDEKTDIEKNLFCDYYANNLMRFLTEDYRDRNGEYEREPSGQGINYKNFAEMIYLYFISTDYKPWEKIAHANEMINRVQESESKPKSINVNNPDKFYKDLFTEDILDLKEDKFEEFICDYYNYNTSAGNYTIGVFQLEPEQNSALNVYQSIIADLENELAETNDDFDTLYGLWFADTDTDDFVKSIIGKRTDIDNKKLENFKKLLLRTDSFMKFRNIDNTDNHDMNSTPTNSVKNIKDIFPVLNAKTVTRTSIIVAYYYYYNQRHWNEEKYEWMSFKDLFDDFSSKIKPKLEAAYYQPLNGKNIFDVLVVFSSYAYINHNCA